MISVVKPILVNFSADKKLYIEIRRILGKFPNNITLYKLALSQRSHILKNSKQQTNERLEYLGDAVVGSIVAEYLYKQFPKKQEGFLTKLRSRIISRQSLNALSNESGLAKLIKKNDKKNESKDAPGNMFEAICGAMLLDFGYDKTKKIFIKRFLKYINLEKLQKEETDYKSRVLELAQKRKRQLVFEYFEEGQLQESNHFRVMLLDLDNQSQLGEGYGVSKKEASQIAAKQAIELGKIN